MIKRLLYRLIHDALYDWYVEVEEGKETVLQFVIHWAIWVGGFIIAHIIWAIILFLVFVYELEFYQFITCILLILAGYFMVWYFVDKLYEGDRPTIDGVNDKWII